MKKLAAKRMGAALVAALLAWGMTGVAQAAPQGPNGVVFHFDCSHNGPFFDGELASSNGNWSAIVITNNPPPSDPHFYTVSGHVVQVTGWQLWDVAQNTYVSFTKNSHDTQTGQYIHCLVYTDTPTFIGPGGAVYRYGSVTGVVH